ncbi:hypothetical protein Efla_001028 [Eimeria flavescens]
MSPESLQSLNGTEACMYIGLVLLLGCIFKRLHRQVSFELEFQAFLNATSALLREGCDVQDLRRRTFEYFGDETTMRIVSDRHTTDYLKRIILSGSREANQDVAGIASELAGLGLPIDSSRLPSILRRSQEVAFFPKPQHVLYRLQDGVKPCGAVNWLLLVTGVIGRDVSHMCHAIFKDPASCLLALAM